MNVKQALKGTPFAGKADCIELYAKRAGCLDRDGQLTKPNSLASTGATEVCGYSVFLVIGALYEAMQAKEADEQGAEEVTEPVPKQLSSKLKKKPAPPDSEPAETGKE